MNMTLLQESISKLVNSSIFYENFEKEVTQDTMNYIPYRKKEDQISRHTSPTDEEYQKKKKICPR